MADDDYMYRTEDVDADLEPDRVEFTYLRCTGIDTDTGAPVYGNDGSVTVTWTKADGLLSKVEGITPNSFETALATDVTSFTVTPIAIDSGGTVYGNRQKLSMTMAQNIGTGEQVDITTERTVFMRAYKFDNDGVDGSVNNSSGTGEGSTSADTSDPTPVLETTGTNPPVLSWSSNSGAGGDLVTVVTIASSGNGYTVDPDSIRVTLPEDALGFTVSNPTRNAGNYEITIQGTLSGSTAIQVFAQASKNGTICTTTEKNWF